MTEAPHSPLTQFEIHQILPVTVGTMDLSFTNSSLFMAVALGVIWLFFKCSVSRPLLVPGRLQCAAEMFYEFISGMLKENVGEEGKKFLPLVFSVFMFVLTCNVLGLIPGAFTVTSHIAVTFALAAFLFVVINVYGFMKHGLHFLAMFAPKGVPAPILLLIVPIEFFSYLVRPVSLSIRLAANMMAGHTMLKVIAGFVAPLGLLGVLPIGFLTVMTGFELFVAVLQAYIFTLLLCVYLSDAVHSH